MKLTPRSVEKPWGRHTLPSPFTNTSGEKIGEIWFEGQSAADLPFLVKYIFTSERLSVQVHPNDLQAVAGGAERGKTECWYVLDAEPGAEIGLGLNRSTDAEGLRSAALDGSAVDLLNWIKVEAGDFFYVPAGTIHAIGAGVSLLEFQQNSDITYRLYDYGRPRDLHLDQAVAVAWLDPHDQSAGKADDGQLTIFHDGDDFAFLRATAGAVLPDRLSQRQRWVMPLAGQVSLESGETAHAGDCLLADPGIQIRMSSDAVAMIGAAGPARR